MLRNTFRCGMCWLIYGSISACCVAQVPPHPEYALYFDGDGLPIAPASQIAPECVDRGAPPRRGWAVISDDCFTGKYVPLILNGIRASQKHSVLLFVHGGLNSLEDARERVDRLIATGDNAGTLLHDRYPIFINWQASFTSSYVDHLVRVRQGIPSPGIAIPTAPYILVKDLAFGAVRSLPDTLELVYNRIDWHKKPICFDPPAPEYRLQKLSGCNESGPAIDYRWGHDLRTPIQRFTFFLEGVPWMPVKPLTTGMVVDGLGSEAWKIMTRRTELMFHPEFAAVNAEHRIDSRSLTYFLQQLTAVVRGTSICQADDCNVDFVAHSAGGIIMNKALREVPELPVRNIVYMAAASSEEDYETTLLGDGSEVSGFLVLHPHTQTYHLVLQPKAEINEHDFGPFEFIPRGSLLYWIDNFLAEAEYPRALTAGRITNLAQRLDAIPTTLRARVHVKVFDYGGQIGSPPRHGSKEQLLSWYRWCEDNRASCQPQRHGDFSEMPFWEDWFWNPHFETVQKFARYPHARSVALPPGLSRN
jgi:hypothetical protein